MNCKMLLAAMVLAGARLAFASEAPHHAEAAHESASHETAQLDYTHPTIPQRADWAGATVIGILGMFLLAAAVGVGVRLNTPEEMPVTHSHDEPPGASHHHGPGGTVQPGPEHDLPGGHAHHH